MSWARAVTSLTSCARMPGRCRDMDGGLFPRLVQDDRHNSTAERGASRLALDASNGNDAHLRSVLNASGIGTFIWRIDEDRFQPDERLLALVGLPPGLTFSRVEFIISVIDREDRDRCNDAFVEAVDTGSLREEMRVVHADGTVRCLAITGHVVVEPVTTTGSTSTDRQRAVLMSGIAIDVTDRKRREANLVLLDQVADDCACVFSADAIVKAVGARLGRHLHVSSVFLAEVDGPRDEMNVTHLWNEEGAPLRPGVARISTLLGADLRSAAAAGRVLIVKDTETDGHTNAQAHRALQVRSFIGVPFVRNGVWTSSFGVCDTRPRHWRDDEIELVRRLADRLFARLEHAAAEHAVANDLRDTRLLRDLSARLVSESDTQTFFDEIVAAAIAFTGAAAGCLQLVDPACGDLHIIACKGCDAHLARRLGRLGAASPGSSGVALRTGALAVVHFDDPDLPDPDGSVGLLLAGGILSAQSTPLITRAGRTVGMLTTHWRESQRRLSEREVRLLDLLARQAAEMIERRLTEDALRESEQRLSEELADTRLLQRISAQLIEEQGTESLYQTLVDGACSIMRSEVASMQMLHPERGSGGELRLLASRGFDDEAWRLFGWVGVDRHTSCARVLQTGARVVAPDILQCEFMAGTLDQASLLAAGVRASHSTPLVSRAGKVLGVISTHWTAPHQPSERDLRLLDILARQAADLLERTQAQDALRRSESQLKDADRRKDEFLATLAHELRNPLAPLRTSLELIRLRPYTPSDIEEVRLAMEEQVGVLVRLVDDLLDVSRITSGKIRLQRQPTLLASLVAGAVQANQAAVDAGQLSLSISLPDTPIVLDADPTRLVQVISNVLHNAIKFTDPGGRVSISAEPTPAANGATPDVILTVADSGVGIPKEMLPRVFDLFTQDAATAHRSHTGLGVGLPLARQLIEMHGGSIEARSDGSGKGSTFILRLPMSAQIADAAPADPSPVAPRISRRVVVIDDNPAAARAIQRLVSALGGECRVAHNGETGLAHIREFRPDVVILDIGMPRLDGYETCRRIRAEFGSEVIVVALTGWGQERDKQNAIDAGFDVHLTKPADPIALEHLLAGADPAEALQSNAS
jgi:signal transduction histidine kinase/CheY-like chemotaxis protein/PAS domain-containing protein